MPDPTHKVVKNLVHGGTPPFKVVVLDEELNPEIWKDVKRGSFEVCMKFVRDQKPPKDAEAEVQA